MTAAIEQNLVLQSTIDANSQGVVGFDIPTAIDVILLGYGYSWIRNATFQLDTGQAKLPVRSDQEGSTSQPVIFGIPFECRSGNRCQVIVQNNNSTAQTITALFKIRTTRIIEESSAGGELILNTGLTGSNLLETAAMSYAITAGSPIVTGIIQNMFSADATNYWGVSVGAPSSGSNAVVLSIDLGAIVSYKTLSYAYNLTPINATNYAQFSLDTSTDNSNWTAILAKSSSVSAEGGIQSAQQILSSVRYIRATLNAYRGGVSTQTDALLYYLSVI